MAEKVFVVELDAINGAALKKIEEINQKTQIVAERMTQAFDRVNKAIETQTKKTGSSISQFSKRDLGMLTTQLIATTDITGKLGNQLSSLATGLMTGGFIGAAFAGLSAVINNANMRTREFNQTLKILSDNSTDIATKINLYRTEMEKLTPDFWERLQMLYMGMTGQGDMVQFFGNRKKQLQNAYNNMGTGEQGVLGRIQTQIQINEELRDSANSVKDVARYQGIINDLQNQYDNLLGKTKEKKQEIVDLTIKEYDVMEDIYEAIREDEDRILGNVEIGSGKPGTGRFDRIWDPKKKFFKESIEEAQSPMTGLVSLSNQMASNFQFAGHTFVGQLSQAIAMVDSISNMILTIASIFGGGGGFGIGGLLSLIGLEKGGRVTNLHGAVTQMKIPSFASGGSYTTPNYGGAYPVLVHKNETLDVYNAGQTSRMEKTLNQMRNLLYSNALHTSAIRSNTRDLNNRPIVVSIDGIKLFEINERRRNRAMRAGKHLDEIL